MEYPISNLAGYMKRCQNRYFVAANNMANSATGGFKRNLVIEREGISQTIVDQSPGPFTETGNPLDLAVKGKCYFVIGTPEGNRYASYGSFRLDERRRLVSQRGVPVLDAEGNSITISGSPSITKDGDIYSGDEKVARLAVVKPADQSGLTCDGDGLLSFTPVTAKPGDYSIKSGYLEGSNVDPIEEMTAAIAILREFEVTQRILKINQMISEKCANDIGNTSR